MSRPTIRHLLSLTVLTAGAVASVATSGPPVPPSGELEASATSAGATLDSSNRIASATVTIALNEAGTSDVDYLYGGLSIDMGACVGAEQAPSRLRVSLIPELPIAGSIIEMDVPACPGNAAIHLGVFAWNSCTLGEACAERYDVHVERLDAATATSGMGIVFTASANASGYEDEVPPEGAELTVVIE